MRVGLALMVAALFAGEAQAADQFDLVCKGEMREFPQKPGSAASERYRIDLAQREWCIGDCTIVRRLQEVTSGRITFVDEDDKLVGRTEYHWIDRVTGDWTRFINERRPSRLFMSIKGSCEAAPFSGIGSQRKF